MRRTPSFKRLAPASAQASRAAAGASRKAGTTCELLLRRALWRLGYRYRLNAIGLAGRPDIVFPRHRVAVFCDGDFWHGRDLVRRLNRLAAGHNAAYWTAKICANVERDARNTKALEKLGWTVLRFWEGDIVRAPLQVAARIVRTLGRLSRAKRD